MCWNKMNILWQLVIVFLTVFQVWRLFRKKPEKGHKINSCRPHWNVHNNFRTSPMHWNLWRAMHLPPKRNNRYFLRIIAIIMQSCHIVAHFCWLVHSDWDGGGGYFGNIPWHFKVQSLVGICLHRMLTWRHLRASNVKIQPGNVIFLKSLLCFLYNFFIPHCYVFWNF